MGKVAIFNVETREGIIEKVILGQILEGEGVTQANIQEENTPGRGTSTKALRWTQKAHIQGNNREASEWRKGR